MRAARARHKARLVCEAGVSLYALRGVGFSAFTLPLAEGATVDAPAA